MGFRVIVSQRAQKEIGNAIDYYSLQSTDAPINFVLELQKTYEKLSEKPFYGFRYKNIRALKIRKFPYLLYFILNEKQLTVNGIACFHGKRNPKRRP